MKFLRQIWNFFVFSNLFIALCVVLMAMQTYRYLLQIPVNWNFEGFVFFSTLASYSFHWYLTSSSVLPSRRIAWLKYHKNVHLVLFFAGIAGALYFFYFLRAHWFWLAGSALITFLYSAPKIPHPLFRMLRKVALGKTIFLALVWMYVTTLLPALVSATQWNGSLVFFSIHRFFLIYAICILFDYRDRQDDKLAGIRSLITYLSETNITRLFYASIIVALAGALALLAWHFNALSIGWLVLPVIITGALYNYARTHFYDQFYYFVLDGLMALSAMLMLIAGN